MREPGHSTTSCTPKSTRARKSTRAVTVAGLVTASPWLARRSRPHAHSNGQWFLHFGRRPAGRVRASPSRSEEHTSELQSRGHLVCRLLLEKKKTTMQL